MHMEDPKMFIYNLFPLLAGPFTRWEGHISRAKDMDFNWIFVNPIQEPGSSGSIYAIRDYFKINPALCEPDSERSPEEQVKDMVAIAEKKGLKMMIDLVINHCSIDSPLLDERPEWFERDGKGKVVNPWADQNGRKVVWRDLARFDYLKQRDTEGLFHYFLNLLKYLIKLGFRAFRCDAAYQVPPGVWQRLIGEIRKSEPDILFLAETLGCTARQTKQTASAGFDFIFNSSKYWDYNRGWLIRQYELTRDIAPSVSFPESHDTVRLCEELDGNVNGLKQRYLFAGLFSAAVMSTAGFEFGFRKKPHVAKTTPEDWEEIAIDIRGFIRGINRIKERYSVFREEAATRIYTEGNPQVLVMWKGSSQTGQEALVILNKDIRNFQTFEVPDIYDLVESRRGLIDVSPENRMKVIPISFSYDLSPGEGRVLVTGEDEVFQADANMR